MSGSGGGGYVPPQSAKFDCNTGIINTSVSSVDLTVLSSQNIGDILQVELSETETVVLSDGNGEILGSIIHTNTADLIECIKSGNEYEAVITSINTPSCRVKIERI
ncbi:hypothetical protein OK344_08080 [Kaistella sp. BT6-1-3]|uniref:Uncharacterized protein n=1 Tax=Kaistella yananensis TaxID=2989820 RepID=A0ABT3JNW2_9FLAO|nr:hypothetical protein [Kaistella yananensis]MCW4452165.1 hypothetical protein [Kaistella yananensis]